VAQPGCTLALQSLCGGAASGSLTFSSASSKTNRLHQSTSRRDEDLTLAVAARCRCDVQRASCRVHHGRAHDHLGDLQLGLGHWHVRVPGHDDGHRHGRLLRLGLSGHDVGHAGLDAGLLERRRQHQRGLASGHRLLRQRHRRHVRHLHGLGQLGSDLGLELTLHVRLVRELN
jgi:hypothetical protein